MDVFEGIRTLLAVRRYQDRPVPDTIVRKIVEAGRLTGSAMNLQPWHFIVVRDKETLRQLGQLAPTGPYIPQAPLAIVVAMDRSSLVGRGGNLRRTQGESATFTKSTLRMLNFDSLATREM